MNLVTKILEDKEYTHKKMQYGLDAPEMTIYHRELILRKKFIKKLYEDWYKSILARIDRSGKVLELGSGGGFLNNIFQTVITSDILPLPNCDMTIDAKELPFKNEELTAIVMVNTLHHMGECDKFFYEAERVLASGGKIVMLEPANTLWSRFFYKNFHHEPFNEKVIDWHFPSGGPLSAANEALPWIIFARDREKFQKLFPNLEIKTIKLHTPLLYLLSGGLSFRSFMPSWMYKPAKLCELALTPILGWIAMFQTIELQKK